MKKARIGVGRAVLSAICLLFVSWLFQPTSAAAYPGWTENRLIAHAMGGISGKEVTNTYEAFLVNYEKGHRLFEVDLILSEEGKLVARHDWLEYTAVFLGQSLPEEKLGSPLTVKEFKSAKVMDKYKPLTFLDILKLLRDYPDVTFITDTKELDPETIRRQFEYMTKAAAAFDPVLLDRIVPEIYTPEMNYIVESIHKFPSKIFSIYMSALTPEEVADYASASGFSVVAMPVERAAEPFVSALLDNGILTYVHTTNSAEELKRLHEIGVYGFYSDFLTPRSLRVIEQPLEPAAEPVEEVRRTTDAVLFLVLMQIVFLLALRKYRSGEIRP